MLKGDIANMFEVFDWERAILRELAERQAEFSALPVMAERKKLWHSVNTGRSGKRPAVVIEEGTFDRDLCQKASTGAKANSVGRLSSSCYRCCAAMS
jgi:hypothetical protein